MIEDGMEMDGYGECRHGLPDDMPCKACEVEMSPAVRKAMDRFHRKLEELRASKPVDEAKTMVE